MRNLLSYAIILVDVVAIIALDSISSETRSVAHDWRCNAMS